MHEHITAALEYESKQAEGDQALLFGDEDTADAERSPISHFIRDVLSDYRPRSLDELKAIALNRGIDFKDKNPGRVLHFALVGMAQSKLVVSLGSGSWKLSPPKRADGEVAVTADGTIM